MEQPTRLRLYVTTRDDALVRRVRRGLGDPDLARAVDVLDVLSNSSLATEDEILVTPSLVVVDRPDLGRVIGPMTEPATLRALAQRIELAPAPPESP